MENKKTMFALIGVAGYIAPKHVKAIHSIGGDLVAICDIHDNVGYIDKYFPNAKFFIDTDEFYSYIKNQNIDYLSICTPNSTHQQFILRGLNLGFDVICEKPLCITPKQVNEILQAEKTTNQKCYSILQLRYNQSVVKLKTVGIKSHNTVDIRYITPRGDWYDSSWKTNEKVSGGLLFNIGIHLFDILIHLFGNLKEIIYIENNKNNSIGKIILENATVNFFLSIDRDDLPNKKWKPIRKMRINNDEYDLTKNFTDLHTESYQKILDGHGIRAIESLPSISCVTDLYKNPPKSFDYTIIIPSYNRYYMLCDLIKQINNLGNNKIKIVVINDSSTEPEYSTLHNKFPEVDILTTKRNNGKHGYWKTINIGLSHLKSIETKSVIFLADDLILNSAFFEVLDDLDYKGKKYSNLFYTGTSSQWGYKDYIDGAFIINKKFFEEVNFRIEEIHMSRWRTNPHLSSGVWHQVTKKLHVMGYTPNKISYSLTEHIGNEDSKMNAPIRKKEPLVGIKKKLKIVGIASLPDRINCLEDTINSLYHQVDKIIVGLNNYNEIPNF